MNRRILAAAVSAVLMITASPAVPLSTFADFENTHINTGDQREDIVAVAETQIGYHEEPEGETPYNHFVGSMPGCPADGFGYAWCQSFVSWCAAQAGISSSVIKRAPGTYTVSDEFKNRGQWEVSEAYGGNYEPQKGDIIYFSNEHSVNNPSHVGIVTGTSDGMVFTIEGISADEVRAKEYNLSDKYIIGYGVPEYDSIPEEITVPVYDDTISPIADGIYIVENCGTVKNLNYAYGWIQGGGYYPMIVCPEDGTPEQTFRISSSGDGRYRMTSGYDDSVSMNVWAETEADIKAGCDITGFSFDDNNTQYFRFVAAGGGEFIIASAQDSSLVLGTAEKNGYTHVTLQRYSETNSSQMWSLVRLDGPDVTVKGDANCDSIVNVADAVAVMQYITNQTKYPLTGTALENADCDEEPGISGNDAITIQKIDAGILEI